MLFSNMADETVFDGRTMRFVMAEIIRRWLV